MLHCQSWCQLIQPAAFFSPIFIMFKSKMQPLFYFPCVCHHQEDGLRQIFMLTMEVLQEFSRRENLNAQMSSVFQRYLALANQVLSWNFLPPNYILSVTPGNVRMISLTISWFRNMAPEKQVCPSYLYDFFFVCVCIAVVVFVWACHRTYSYFGRVNIFSLGEILKLGHCPHF